MKIAFFTNNYYPRLSGVATSVSLLKRHLENSGVEVFVFAPSYQKYDDSEEKNVIRIRSLRFWWLKRFALPIPFFNIRKINRALKKIQPDIIHFHQPFLLGRLALRRGKKLKIPVVFTYHSLYEQYVHYFPFHQGICKRMANYYTRDSANRSDLVISPTEIITEYLKNLGVKTRIEIIPSGVDTRVYSRQLDRSKLVSFKKSLGITSNQRILLHVGRIVNEKNICFLLKAAQKILSEKKDIVLIIVGEGTLLNSCRRLTKHMGLQQQIIWVGAEYPEKLPWYYQASDLFLFTSKTDTQAIVIYEALASGLPVIAVESLASKAIIKNGVNGFRVIENVESFAKAVIDNLDSKDKNASLIKINEYTPSEMAKKIYNLYQKVLASQPLPKKNNSTIFTVQEPF